MDRKSLMRANLLGELRAEKDHATLERAFFESADYKTLIESSSRNLVVGRRGTGKSALAYRLAKHFSASDVTRVISLTPEEDQVIGLRKQFGAFGDQFTRIRSAAKTLWKYALMMELGQHIPFFKLNKVPHVELLQSRLSQWRSGNAGVTSRLFQLLRRTIGPSLSPEEQIAELSRSLDLQQLQNATKHALSQTHRSFVILIDRLDEGYEPDDLGIAIVDGLIQTAIDLNSWLPEAVAYVFVRDNIFRSISHMDPDYSRNLEGSVLRLHWDSHQLFNLVCARLRKALLLDIEEDRRVWNSFANRGLANMDGFKKCLHLTLYRPRDVIALLNQAAMRASMHGQAEIIDADIEATAQSISEDRLADLRKEYEKTFPGTTALTTAFSDGKTHYKAGETAHLLDSVMSSDQHSPEVQQSFRILETGLAAVRALYSIGFVGVQDEGRKHYVFCHDGSPPNQDLKVSDEILVHPCYWIALNLADRAIDEKTAQEIYDEYDIRVISETPEIRTKKIGQILSSLNTIAPGQEDSARFEEWCLRAVEILFAGGLRNCELHPNKQSVSRRDVVGTNFGLTPSLKRVLDDYKVRQLVFEVKNYKNPSLDDYRQVNSYLGNHYGNLAFILCRDDDHAPRAGSELDWVRETYNSQKRLIVKLTATLLSKWLAKLRSPQKHDATDKALNKILDDYERIYVMTASSQAARRCGGSKNR